MKIISKIIKFLDKLINLIITFFFICAIIFGGYGLYDTYYVYDKAKLSDDILKFKPSEENNFSIASLQNINEDIRGWIKMDNTNIDYPIVIGEDNNEYLDKDYKKEFSTAGSIFMDYRNNKDFNNDYTIIYGHNMKSNQMFADVKRFEEKQFFDTHEKGTLYTANDVYEIQIYSFQKVDAFSDTTYNLRTYKDKRNKDLITFFTQNAMYKKTVNISEKDKILVLSTCDNAGGNERSILIGKLIKKDISEIITKETNSNNSQITIQRNTAKRKSDKKVFWKAIIIIIVLIILIILLIIIIKTKSKKQKNKNIERQN